MFQTECVEETKTHILCSVNFSENRDPYEIIWENLAEPYKPQMTIWRIRAACWINKATDVPSEYIILIAFYGNNGYRYATER